MTLLEVVFALFMFAGSSAASMFALSTTLVQLKTLNDMHSVHDAANEVCTLWYAGKVLPPRVTSDGNVCIVNTDNAADQGAVHIEIRSGNASQNIWVYAGS